MNFKKNAKLKMVLAAFILTGSVYSGKINGQVSNVKTVEKEQSYMLVKYLGIEKGMLAFNVSFTQPVLNRVTLRIADEDFNELYSEGITSAAFTKKIFIPAEMIERVSFRILTGKNEFKKTFFVGYEVTETFQVKEISEN